PVPSLIWLQLFDKIDRGGAGALYLDEKAGFQFLDLAPEGELRSSVRHAAVRENHRIHDEIEAGPEGGDRFRPQHAPNWRHFLDDFDPNHSLAGLRIFLTEETIGLAGIRGFDLGIEVEDVFFSPFDLNLRPKQQV